MFWRQTELCRKNKAISSLVLIFIRGKGCVLEIKQLGYWQLKIVVVCHYTMLCKYGKQTRDFWGVLAGSTRQNFCLLCKKTVNECCRRVRPACFALTKFCRPYQTSKKPRQKIGEPLGLSDFLSGDFIALSCLFSVTKPISTFQRIYRYGINLN